MIVFAHTKFGLVRIQGSGVKRGGGIHPPRSERVFQIPVQIGLRVRRNVSDRDLNDKMFIENMVKYKAYRLESGYASD